MTGAGFRWWNYRREMAEANGYGLWAPSNSVEAFTAAVDKLLSSDLPAMGERGYRFFLENYTVEKTYEAIVGHLPGLVDWNFE